MTPIRIEPPLHISKYVDVPISTLKYLLDRFFKQLNKLRWVDYSNKYGFGCLLSDGTTSVKFNSGEIIALRFLLHFICTYLKKDGYTTPISSLNVI